MGEQVSLGQFIAVRRKRMFLTQEEFAEKLFVSKSAVAKWETDGGIPDRDNLYKLAEVLSVSVDDLHRLIARSEYADAGCAINITSDVIAMLESYGYKVIRPEKEETK